MFKFAQWLHRLSLLAGLLPTLAGAEENASGPNIIGMLDFSSPREIRLTVPVSTYLLTNDPVLPAMFGARYSFGPVSFGAHLSFYQELSWYDGAGMALSLDAGVRWCSKGEVRLCVGSEVSVGVNIFGEYENMHHAALAVQDPVHYPFSNPALRPLAGGSLSFRDLSFQVEGGLVHFIDSYFWDPDEDWVGNSEDPVMGFHQTMAILAAAVEWRILERLKTSAGWRMIGAYHFVTVGFAWDFSRVSPSVTFSVPLHNPKHQTDDNDMGQYAITLGIAIKL